jgi:nitric oxide reductase subunit B
VAGDVWIFLNLTVALAISVPAINVYTHGTYVTVAHAMGSTIGINTMILLASSFYVIMDVTRAQFSSSQKGSIQAGFWILNFFFLIFWMALLISGIQKGMLIVQGVLSFQEIMQRINPFLILFCCAGIGLVFGFLLILIPTLKVVFAYLKK